MPPKRECRFTHHVSLSAVLSRSDEDVIPGQQEQQSQRDHAELKVPHHHDEELSRWTERKKRLDVKEQNSGKGHTGHSFNPAHCFIFSLQSRYYSVFLFLFNSNRKITSMEFYISNIYKRYNVNRRVLNHVTGSKCNKNRTLLFSKYSICFNIFFILFQSGLQQIWSLSREHSVMHEYTLHTHIHRQTNMGHLVQPVYLQYRHVFGRCEETEEL